MSRCGYTAVTLGQEPGLDGARLEEDVLELASKLPRRVQRRFNGRQLTDIARDPLFHKLVQHYASVAIVGRPAARRESHRSRPGHRRTGASSRTAAQDPGD